MSTYLERTIFLLITLFLGACTRYYQVHTSLPSTIQSKLATVDSLVNQNKYFVIHANTGAYGVQSLAVNRQDSSITGFLITIPDEHSLYLHPHRHYLFGKMRNYKKEEAAIINEVHLYTENDIKDSAFILPVKNVQKIETVENDKQKTRIMTVGGIVIITGMTIALVIGMIALAQFE